uniref:ERF1 domain-containing protein n=1 Tax=Panagrolaimus sp. PS1159 TaxID=55785 RepID=A0AC35GFB1_9BILA
MLAEEYGTAANIKSSINRQSVLPAITSVHARLRLYTKALLNDHKKFGFIIIDGNGALCGILQGNNREILHKFTVDLPNKNDRGDSGKFVFGLQNIWQALEIRAIETLICWENLDISRLKLINANGKENVLNLRPNQMSHDNYLVDPNDGSKMELVETVSLLYKKFGTQIEIVTDHSQEGAQFTRGFGGIGGILRYIIDFSLIEENGDENEINLDDY